jgi:hypothetical protein
MLEEIVRIPETLNKLVAHLLQGVNQVGSGWSSVRMDLTEVLAEKFDR